MKKTVKILLAWVLALVCVMTVPGMSVAAATAAQKEEAQVSEEVLEEVSEDVTEEREETAEEVTEEATEEETEEVSEEVTEETTEKVAEETAEETTEEAVEEVTEEATEEVTEEVTEEETKETEIEEIGRKDADVDEKGLKSEETEREVIPDAGILGDPQTVTATIKVDGSYTAEIKSPGEIKYYKFVPTADGTYVLTSTAEMDTYGHLYDADWDQIATNDDGGSNGNFRLSYQMTAGTTYYYGVRFYSTYDTGSIPFNLTKVKTGWNQVGDDWYYVLEDGNNAQGFLEINGKTYYFDYNGKMMTNYAAYKYEDGEQKYFWLGSNGVLYTKTGWFTYNNYGTEYRYYVQDSTGRLAYGWTELNGTRYYFGPSMASNGSREIYDQSSETYKHYFFTENGALVTKIGWVKTSYGDWFYVKDTSGELYSNELVTIGSKQYYFGYSGRMTVDSSFTIGEKPYVADGNGYVTELKAGWNKAGDNYYYLKDDGTIAKSEVLKIGSYYYGFGYAGIMYDDTTFSFYNSGNYYYYRAKAGGKLYVNAWYKTEYGEWYYYGAEGKGADGIETVGGKQYYFSSARMITNDLFYYEGSTYYANSSGELQLLKEGWNLVHVEHEYDDYAEDRYCYVAEGSFFSHQVAKIGSDWYGFNYEGWMYEDEVFNMGSDSTSVYYRAKANGKLYVNSWYQEGENWYYYGEGGAAPSGLFTVSGKQYLFNYRGLMCVNRYQPSGDYLYYADAKGAATKVTKDGLYRGGGIYYVQGGRIFKGGWKTVDGKSYFFNSAGQAYTRRNGTVQIDGKCYLFNDDGVMEKGSWIHDYDEVYYAGSDGALYIGEHKIDGQWYYFNSYGRMLTGLVMYNGKLYLCATDGHYIGTAKGNGWNEISGSWYYVENNQLVGYGTKTIGGVMYYFNGGLMMTDSTYDGYVFGSNGKQVKSGWVMMRGVYYYVDSATGKYVTGDKTISGKEYYFVQNGMMFTGERIINDTEKRVYGANGAL
ncbi:MAG: hypothetical protein IJM26_10410, partial [Lachnospiraceae bacterium]|nr:hypothetical protein [Lachnospiraceae bacterium]